MWAKGKLVLKACPKPEIEGKSLALLEAYSLWVRHGRTLLPDLNARCLDAFGWIEQLRAEARAEAIPLEKRRRG